MKGVVLILRNLHDGVSKWCGYIGGLMTLAMALMLTYDVAMRFLFTRPTSWALDFTSYMMLYSTFLAAGWLFKLNAHVRVTILTERLGPKSKLILFFFISVIGVLTTGVLTWQSTVDVWDTLTRGSMILRPVAVPKFLILAVIPLGTLLLLGYFLRDFYRHWLTIYK